MTLISKTAFQTFHTTLAHEDTPPYESLQNVQQFRTCESFFKNVNPRCDLDNDDSNQSFFVSFWLMTMHSQMNYRCKSLKVITWINGSSYKDGIYLSKEKYTIPCLKLQSWTQSALFIFTTTDMQTHILSLWSTQIYFAEHITQLLKGDEKQI